MLNQSLKFMTDKFFSLAPEAGYDDLLNLTELRKFRQLTTIKGICFFGVVYLTIFSAIALNTQKQFVAGADLCMVLILVLYSIRIQISKRIRNQEVMFVIALIGLYFGFIYFAESMKGVGFLWAFTYPLLAFFLLGSKYGALMTILLLGWIMLGEVFARHYSAYFLIRFYSAYAATGILAFAFECIRSKTEISLILKNENLKTMLGELIAAEQSIQDSRRRYRDLVETVEDWIWEIDRQGRYTYTSPQVEHILGYAPESIIGKNPTDLVTPEQRDATTVKMAELGHRKGIFTGLEGLFQHKDGHTVVLETNGMPFLDESGELLGYRGVTRDVTIRREAQKEHEERKKLQGALEVVGAVCHELNQPMMAISGYAELLTSREELDPSIAAALKKIHNQIDRMGGITLKLMNITRYETRQYSGGSIILDINKSSHF